MKKYFIVLLLCGMIGFAGCAWLNKEITPTKNPVTGVVSAPIQDKLAEIKPMVDTLSFIPGVGQIAQSAFLLISLIAGGAVAVKARSNGAMLNTTIAGVEEARKDYKSAFGEILDIAKAISPDAANKVQAIIDDIINVEKKIDPVVSNISAIGKATGILDMLAQRVQQVTKGA